MRNLTINPERLWGDLMETAKIGGTAKGGICRLTLTDLDREVRGWFRAQAEALGCPSPSTTWARCSRAARALTTCRRSRWAAISTPSRPAASSTARSACWRRSKRCVCWSRPATRPTRRSSRQLDRRGGLALRAAMMAAGVFGGVFSRDWAAARQDRAGVTFGDTLDAIGYRGPERCGAHPLSAFFEVPSSRALISKPKAATSAWSPACRPSAGSRSPSPARTPTPARRHGPAQERADRRGTAHRMHRRHRQR